MNQLQRLAAAAAVCSLLALAGCGSSDHDDNGGTAPGTGGPGSGSTSGEVPASAFDSVAGLIAYAKMLVATSPDTDLPAAVGTRELPVDDTGSPATL